MKLRILLCLLATLMLAACATGPDGRYYSSSPRNQGYESPRYANCYDCGVVQRIESHYGSDRTSGGGAVLGGIVGGALGNQIGSGSGRTAATVAGAVAGGFAGNEIERRRNESPLYEVHVQLDSGRTVIVEQRDLNGIRPGSRVRLDNGRARLY